MIPEPIVLNLSADQILGIKKFLGESINSLTDSLAPLYTVKVDKWQRIYDGTPREENKSFPWQNASNIVIQVVGQHVDTLKSRIMGQMFDVAPIYNVSKLGKWNPEEEADKQKSLLEQFMIFCALEPQELDLYRVESLMCSETIKFGNSVLKNPYIINKGWNLTSADIKNASPYIKFEGPRPEKLRYQDFLVDRSYNTLEDAPFKAHVLHLTRLDLEDRKNDGSYPKQACEDILKLPSRRGYTDAQAEQMRKEGVEPPQSLYSDVYDLYECYYSYWLGSYKVDLICTYHLLTNTLVKCVVNWLPKGQSPFIMYRLGYDKDGMQGAGFCEMLEDYQEEVTTNHNQRADNRTVANTSIIRVGKSTKFDAHFGFMPQMTIPADKDDIEAIRFGANYPSSVSEEMLTLKLAEDRTGVGGSSSSSGGLGSGTVGKTTGAYSSMGTMAIMQDNNKRVNANTTDIKYSHIKLGRMCMDYYAEFGAGKRLDYFGDDAPLLAKALESWKSGRLGFSIKTATASVNREVEKQNDLLLSGIAQKHYTAIGQLIQAVQSPQIDPVLKNYLLKVITASDKLMSKIMVNFGHDDEDTLVPDPLITGAPANATQPNGTTTQNVGGVPMGATMPPTGNSPPPSQTGSSETN